MRALLCFALVLGTASALDCPQQYFFTEGRCIRVFSKKTKQIKISEMLPQYREECGKDNAHLPIIKNDEDQISFNNIIQLIEGIDANPFILLDLACNSSSRRLEWIDGIVATYSWKNSVNFDFDCVSTMQTASSAPYYDDWELERVDRERSGYAVLCVYDGPLPTTASAPTTPSPIDGAQCGDFAPIDIPTDSKPCIRVHTAPLSWIDAQMTCASVYASLLTINSAEENKYFWRTAISNGVVNGMHIGAHLSKNSQWTWEDGEVAIDGKIYDNFASFFPIPGGGDCVSMATENSAAFWVNENCDGNEQAFICRRADFSAIPSSCPTAAPQPGEDIFSPGLPDSASPCEYYLFVAPGKLVEIEILTLIAEESKDYLDLLEGTSGNHVIASLTGTVLRTKFTTVNSNVLRVNWKPNRSCSGRGFRIRYYEVVE